MVVVVDDLEGDGFDREGFEEEEDRFVVRLGLRILVKKVCEESVGRERVC